MKIQGYHEDKAELQEVLEHIAKQEFQTCFQVWERQWVTCLNQERVPLNETVLNCN